MSKQNDHSEEYKKGYRVGYNAGYIKGKGHPKATKPQLYDLGKAKPLVKWEHIDGDEETFHCPLCGENFYSEDKQAPNFCWFCGAQSVDAKRGVNMNEKGVL